LHEGTIIEKVPLLLYVEDEGLIAMSATVAFEEAGFAVEHFQSGGDAAAALRERAAQYQALVTDVRLPQVDGWELARLAREVNSSIPVVYVSGDSAADWPAYGVPNSLMLQKPFAMAQMVAAVTTLLNQAAAAPTPPAGGTSSASDAHMVGG
jgi:DNA-binding response OmpR family regulator